MKFATVRDFKLHATRYLKGRSDIYITRRGRPVAVLSPLREKSPEKAMAEMGQIIRKARLSKKELLELLEEARKEVYLSRPQGRCLSFLGEGRSGRLSGDGRSGPPLSIRE